MRLPESKIKEAILHPEKTVRYMALNYFAYSRHPDADVMPLAIKSLETHGREEAFPYVFLLADLTQTEATVEWAIRELNREAPTPFDIDSYLPVLSSLLCSAPAEILLPRADDIRKAPGFTKVNRAAFEDLLRVARWDADRCWKELEDISSAAVRDEEYGIDSGHVSRVVRALARQGDAYRERVLELLEKKIDDFNDPMLWMEIFLVELAGEMRLAPAIPFLVDKLHADEEILSEECVDALSMIGTDAAAEAIARDWLVAPWEYRLYATGALENIHSDTTVRVCQELLPLDPDIDIRTKLAEALLAQMPKEGIEPVREMIRTGEYDSSDSDLMERLIAVSTLTEATFPEQAAWKRQVEKKRAEQARRVAEMRRTFRFAPPFEKAAQDIDEKPFREPAALRQPGPAPYMRVEKKVGRNDSCPCGSGKKFKKCCMGKD